MRPIVGVLLVGCAAKGPAVDVDSDAPADTDVAPIATDTDTDVAVDTGDSARDGVDSDRTPADSDTGPFGVTVIRVRQTADDAWQLWIDGQEVTAPGQLAWRSVDDVTVTVPGQRHVVAVHAYDLARVVSGHLAAVWANEELVAVSGDGQWLGGGDVAPDPAWIERDFDDAAWTPVAPCTSVDELVWGRGVADVAALLDLGAHWQWARPCRSLGEAWLRLRLGPR